MIPIFRHADPALKIKSGNNILNNVSINLSSQLNARQDNTSIKIQKLAKTSPQLNQTEEQKLGKDRLLLIPAQAQILAVLQDKLLVQVLIRSVLLPPPSGVQVTLLVTSVQIPPHLTMSTLTSASNALKVQSGQHPHIVVKNSHLSVLPVRHTIFPHKNAKCKLTAKPIRFTTQPLVNAIPTVPLVKSECALLSLLSGMPKHSIAKNVMNQLLFGTQLSKNAKAALIIRLGTQISLYASRLSSNVLPAKL